ncbi:hypothetical protein DM860_017785 [Cuscuta australis]|uniref:HAT C-terminal dimerisation domain-containing protein n=1 Tax=Cuscuta australis TaxID=267555 RepID=A0A328DXN8_9ASTE|nr:hypothetical protein DM860_017785 [Cuscuta australis]
MHKKKQHLLRPQSKKGFKEIVGGLLAKRGVPCDYDEDNDRDFNVLEWWKRNEHMFPSLGMLTRQVLSMPVSIVAVEPQFSSSGNILTDYRSCLSAESLETLVYIRDWLFARRRA